MGKRSPQVRDMRKEAAKKKEGRLDAPVKAAYAVLAAVAIICATIMTVVIAINLADDDEGRDKAPRTIIPHLYIDEVFFRSYESHAISLVITLYITNDGLKDATDVKVHIWPVVEESNIATDVVVLELGNVLVNQTASDEEMVELKAASVHSVELLVFESGKIVLKGRASVSTQGSGGSSSTEVEARGATGDDDYDGMSDDWERYYGLDPSDPTDAKEDMDHDGVTNLDEFRLNRDPGRGSMPGDDDDSNDIISVIPEPEEGDGAAFFGAGFIFLVVIGAAAALVVFGIMKGRKKAMGEKKSSRSASPALRAPGGENEQNGDAPEMMDEAPARTEEGPVDEEKEEEKPRYGSGELFE